MSSTMLCRLQFFIWAAVLGFATLAHAQTAPNTVQFPLCSHGYAAAYEPSFDTHNYCTGPAKTFYVTFAQVGLQRSDGAIFWVGGVKTFNVASASVGGEVGAYLSNIQLPKGTYPIVRAKLLLTQTVQGSPVTAAGTGQTCGGSAVTALRGYDNGDLCSVAGIPAPYQNNVTPHQGCTDGTYDYAASQLLTPLVVTGPSSSGTIVFSSDVRGGVLYDLGTSKSYCHPMAPGNFKPTLTSQ